jgi:hypothetical protein
VLPWHEVLAPVSPAKFFDEYWGRRSVHVRGDGSRFAALAPLATLQTVLPGSSAVDAATRDEMGRQVQTRVEPGDALAAMGRGATICADVSQHPLVAQLLHSLMEMIRPAAGGAFCKLYASPAEAGFAPHLDGHHVFVLQLAGRKRWRHGNKPVRADSLLGGKIDALGRAVHTYPLDGVPMQAPDGRPIAAPDLARLQTVDLAPGDLLYIPPGTWHATEALETSIALSVSPPRAAIADLLLETLRARLLADPRLWPDLVAPSHARQAGMPRAIGRALHTGLQALRESVAGLDPEALALHWAHETFAVTTVDPTPAADLHDDDVLTHEGFVALVARDPSTGEPAAFVFRPGVELVLPASAESFLAHLHAHPRTTVAQAIAFASEWPPDDTRSLLRELVAAGVLAASTLHH